MYHSGAHQGTHRFTFKYILQFFSKVAIKSIVTLISKGLSLSLHTPPASNPAGIFWDTFLKCFSRFLFSTDASVSRHPFKSRLWIIFQTRPSHVTGALEDLWRHCTNVNGQGPVALQSTKLLIIIIIINEFYLIARPEHLTCMTAYMDPGTFFCCLQQLLDWHLFSFHIKRGRKKYWWAIEKERKKEKKKKRKKGDKREVLHFDRRKMSMVSSSKYRQIFVYTKHLKMMNSRRLRKGDKFFIML